MRIELGLDLKAFNLVTKFEKKTVHICGSYCAETKCDRQTDRQTDGQTQINNPPFFFEKAGDNNVCLKMNNCFTHRRSLGLNCSLESKVVYPKRLYCNSFGYIFYFEVVLSKLIWVLISINIIIMPSKHYSMICISNSVYNCLLMIKYNSF